MPRLRHHWPAFLLLALVLLAGTGLQLAPGLMVRSYLDVVSGAAGSLSKSASAFALAFVVVSLAVQALAVGEGYLAERLAWTVTNDLRTEVTSHCLALDLSFHAEHLPGELVERIDGDISLLANFVSRFVISVLSQALLLLALGGALCVLDWRIGATLLPLGAVGFVLLRYLSARGQQSFLANRQEAAAFSGYAAERLAAVADLAGNGAVPYTLSTIRQRLSRLAKAELSASMWGSIGLWSAASTLTWLGVAASLAWSWQLYHAGAMTLGTAFLVFTYTQQMAGPLDNLTSQNQDYQAAAAAVIRIRGLLDTPLRAAPPNPRPFPDHPPAVEFVDVSFGYRPDTLVLRDISLRVPAGSSLGVVGRTGCGKTTLARLVAGLHDPASGAVRIGGTDVRNIDPGQLRHGLAVVPQEVQIFHATVRDNLTFFREPDPGQSPESQDEDLIRTLSKVGLAEWLARLPAGLDTILGSGGHELSAGEEQLVAFARALSRTPRVVVLDEATSRLDPITEQLLRRATETLLTGRTSIVIAHRLSTLDAVDAVLVLDGGQVVEHGSRVELSQDPDSHFSALLRAASLTGTDSVDAAADHLDTAPPMPARAGGEHGG